MEKALEIIAEEIMVLEMALEQLRKDFDRANDTNKVQDQIAIAVRIAYVAIQLSALKKLQWRLAGGR